MIIKKLITMQDSDNLNRYFTDIKKYPSLSGDEEKELIRKIQDEGDEAALEKMVKCNLKFVVSVAKSYQGQGVPILDLISEGNDGLMEAIKRFDIEKDVKFISYAVWWIRIRIFTKMEFNKRLIQLPANRQGLIQKVKKEIALLEQKFDRLPTLEELVIKLSNYSELDLQEALTLIIHPQSLSDPIGDSDDDMTLEEIIKGDLDVDDSDRQKSLVDELNRYMVNLSQKEYDVMVLSFGLNQEPVLRNSDVAKVLGLKEKDVPNIKTRAAKRLRNLKNINNLKDMF